MHFIEAQQELLFKFVILINSRVLFSFSVTMGQKGEHFLIYQISSIWSNSPEKTFPSGEVSAFEECVLENPFDTTQRLNHVRSVVVQVPQFAVMALVGPPEGVLF